MDKAIYAAKAEDDTFVERFRKPLLGYFERRVRTPEDAEDLTQEVFVRMLRRKGVGEIDNLEAFVFVAAANLLKDYYRLLARRGTMPSIDGLDFISPERNPAEAAEDKAEVVVLLNAIRSLPPKCRMVFVMHRFDEVPHTEIAQRLRISVSMVEKHIAAAVKQLRRNLKDGAHD